MIIDEADHLAHYGILRRSGRYPWGSGGSESTRNRSFLDTIESLRNKGLSEVQIAEGYGITTTQLRAAKTIARAQQKQEQIGTAQRLKEKGYSNVAIGERMGINESSVRALLAPGAKDKADVLQTTSLMLKDQVAQKNYIDVGVGVERHIGVSNDKLKAAVALLQEQGYTLHYVKIQQLDSGNQTTLKVLAKPGTPYSEVFNNRGQIKQITDFSEDGGRSYLGVQDPISVSSRRISVRYAEDGGAKADGVIYVRPGVKDLSIGNSRYAQVRVAVDGTHYLKGMAMYKDDLPPGVDLEFNTNAKNTGRKKDAMKELKDDPDNPFGSIIRQIHGPDGKVSSAMNIVGGKEGAGEEGSWSDWSRQISSQILSKQSPELARKQLNVTYEDRTKALAEITALTNPAVRKKLLESFADSTDAASVHLKAAALPGTAYHVILPISSIKPTEIYAPNFRDGQRVVLVRSPHGGTFEIPELTVNNKNREARKLLGPQAKDAVGIHHAVAHRLSGADFDGDSVLVIPNDRGSIKTSPALEGLKKFDPQVYKIPKGSPIPHITSANKQQEMGKISNLITDMTIRGASTEEKARAVRHSMVVIDAEKHGLDYKQSAKDNGITQLKEKYQGGPRAGAKTLISRAGAETRIPERKPRSQKEGGPIDPVTGKKVFVETGRQVPERKRITDPVTGEKVFVRTGRMVDKQQSVERLSVTEDAFTLSSGTRMEALYAEHSNKLKSLANTARKEMVATKSRPYSPSAKITYADQVASLDAQLNLALKNAPLERQAQVIANQVVSQKRQANPNMLPEDVKKIKQQALAEARVRTQAKKNMIRLTQHEWDAIQAGAISNSKLEQIINNSDQDTLKKLATPKAERVMTSTKKLRAESMLSSGYTQAEVADALGVSLTTLKTSINE